MKTMTSKVKSEVRTLSNMGDELLTIFEKARNEKDVWLLNEPYQNWYSRSLKVIEALGPERLNEFISFYHRPDRTSLRLATFGIRDLLIGVAPVGEEFDPGDYAESLLRSQIAIVRSLASRIDSVPSDVKGHLLAEIQDAELKAAGALFTVNERAAGALAGVVLEQHLQRVAVNHKVPIAKADPTIGDLNDPLRNANVYDLPTWRKIQMLGDIRNLCSHKKQRDPTPDEVKELIEGVERVIKSVF